MSHAHAEPSFLDNTPLLAGIVTIIIVGSFTAFWCIGTAEAWHIARTHQQARSAPAPTGAPVPAAAPAPAPAAPGAH